MLFHKKTRKIGCMGLAALVLSGLVNNMILKPLIARPRPYELISALTPLIAKPTDYSFPSGHTAASFAAACVFYRNLPKNARGMAAGGRAIAMIFHGISPKQQEKSENKY